MTEKGGNDSTSHERKEELQVIFRKYMNLPRRRMFNNNNLLTILHLVEKNP